MFDPAIKTEFLFREGWDGADETRVGEDWSQRSFARLNKNGKTAILMQSVPDTDPRVTPGHKLGDYVRISAYLRGLGLQAPDVIAQDLERGLLLVEDFGDESLHDLFIRNDPATGAEYLKATDILATLYLRADTNALNLPLYKDSHIHPGRGRLVEWYRPAILHKPNESGIEAGYLAVWDEIEKSLPPVKAVVQHGDYHPHNLMILEDGAIGLIDFQGAMYGAAPYDLVNLLEDARRVVPEEIKAACRRRYTNGMTDEERAAFEAWYAVLSAQFHSRVIGQAVRLAVLSGKTRLIEYIPVLEDYLRRELGNPVLRPVKEFLARHGVDFEKPRALVLDPRLFSGH